MWDYLKTRSIGRPIYIQWAALVSQIGSPTGPAPDIRVVRHSPYPDRCTAAPLEARASPPLHLLALFGYDQHPSETLTKNTDWVSMHMFDGNSDAFSKSAAFSTDNPSEPKGRVSIAFNGDISFLAHNEGCFRAHVALSRSTRVAGRSVYAR